MPKFIKKRIQIEAVQYTGSNFKEVDSFIGMPVERNLESETAYLAGMAPPIFSLIIPTLEGNMKASPGDWIIKGIKGEHYPCKPDIFEATYDSVDALMQDALDIASEILTKHA